MNTIGERIKKRRLELKLSQAGLATLVGKSAGAIGNYESETRAINTDILGFAAALKVSPWLLAFGKEPSGSAISTASTTEKELLEAFRKIGSEQKKYEALGYIKAKADEVNAHSDGAGHSSARKSRKAA